MSQYFTIVKQGGKRNPNYYSAPYTYIGCEVEVIEVNDLVKVFYKGKEIALHVLAVVVKGEHITDKRIFYWSDGQKAVILLIARANIRKLLEYRMITRLGVIGNE